MLCLHHHWLSFLPLLSPLGGGAFRRPRFFRRRGSLAPGGAGVLGGGGLSWQPGPFLSQSGGWRVPPGAFAELGAPGGARQRVLNTTLRQLPGQR